MISCATKAKEEIPQSDHYDIEKDVFFNPYVKEDHGFMDFLKWIFNRNPGPWLKKFLLKLLQTYQLN